LGLAHVPKILGVHEEPQMAHPMTSYQTGAVDFLSVLTTFGSVLEYEMAYFEELALYHTAVSRLEEMTGTPIVH
jgi:hypothetical protein